MNDKRREYGAVVSEPHELLDRYPELTQRIEEELVHNLTDPIVKEAIKGECIVRFTETEQRENFGLLEYRKYVYIEEIVRCKDCKYCILQSNTKDSEELFQYHYCCTIFEQFKNDLMTSVHMEKGESMTNSCGNCKYGECREEYLYPYRCKKEKAISYSEEKWMDRVHHGYVCKKWGLKEVTK